MPGYDPEADYYTLDLEKAAEEFMLADVDKDGIPAGEDPDDVWEMGFRLQMGYNTGNATRQTYAEILQANLAEINEKFVLEVLGCPGLLTWLPNALISSPSWLLAGGRYSRCP
jgi:peptide/nickel transport system substrate-binding protein